MTLPVGREGEPLRTPPVPDIDAPYDLYGLEATEHISVLLDARLGDYYSRQGQARYAYNPTGSHTAGFQEEYPINRFANDEADLVINLVLKGFHLDGMVWLSTHIGLVGRERAKRLNAPIRILFTERLAIHDTFAMDDFRKRGHHTRISPELSDERARPITLGGAFRAVRQLRKARNLLFLPEWVERLQDLQDDDTNQ